MSIIPFTEKNKKKKIRICSILGRIRIRIYSIPEADFITIMNDFLVEL